MEADQRGYTVDVWVDGKIYRAFSVFDTILRERKWVKPALFAAIFCAFASVCFALSNDQNQGVLLGVVLLVVGLGMPLVYFGSYFSSLQRKIEKMRIAEKKRHAYTVTLSKGPEGVTFLTPKGTTTQCAWKDFYMAYRLPKAIYLYPQKTKAYILPKEQAQDCFADIWALIFQNLPADKLKER